MRTQQILTTELEEDLLPRPGFLDSVNKVATEMDFCAFPEAYNVNIMGGWNTLVGEFKHKFVDLKIELKKSVIARKYNQANILFNKYDCLKDWCRGAIVCDPNDIGRSAVISETELISTFRQVISYECFGLAQQIWCDNDRLHEIFRCNKNRNEQLYFLTKITNYKTKGFCYNFLAVFKTKASLFEYLDLINHKYLVNKISEKLKVTYPLMHQYLTEWLDLKTAEITPQVGASSLAFFNQDQPAIAQSAFDYESAINYSPEP